MKILDFADLDTSRVKPAYRKVVAAIANGDFRAAQVRKLAGAGHGKLYRARLNDADRLIFCVLRHNDDICALMLEVIVNHDYEKSRFLRGTVIDEDKIVDCDAAEAEKEAQSLRYLNPERTIVHLLDKPISFRERGSIQQSEAFDAVGRLAHHLQSGRAPSRGPLGQSHSPCRVECGLRHLSRGLLARW